MCARAFRRGLALLICAAALSGCSSVAKQNYLRHLSTTIKPVQPDRNTVSMAVPTNDPGVVVVVPTNRPRP